MKKLLLIVSLLTSYSTFAQVYNGKGVQLSDFVKLSGYTINNFSSDTSEALKRTTAVPTEWTMKIYVAKYFAEHGGAPGGGGPESDPIYTAGIVNYYNKTQSDARYLQSFTESDPVWLSDKPSYLTSASAANIYSVLSHTHAFSSLTSKPTTLSGYGITDAYPLTGNPSGFISSYTETDPVYSGSSWFSTTNNSSNWNTAFGWGNHASAGYATITKLTDSLNKIRDSLLYSKIVQPNRGMISLGDSIVFIGHSWVAGIGASTTAKRWTSLFCNYMNAYEYNMGFSGGTVMKRTPYRYAGGASLIDTLSFIPVKTAKKKLYIIQFALNDFGNTSANYTLANFKTDFDSCMNYITANKAPGDNILLLSDGWIGQAGYTSYAALSGSAAPTYARHDSAVAIIKQTAAKWGTMYLDIKNATKRFGDTTALYDAKHPNDAGHQYIAMTVANFFGFDPNKVDVNSDQNAVAGIKNFSTAISIRASGGALPTTIASSVAPVYLGAKGYLYGVVGGDGMVMAHNYNNASSTNRYIATGIAADIRLANSIDFNVYASGSAGSSLSATKKTWQFLSDGTSVIPGKLYIATGSNQSAGTGTFSAGTATISTNNVTANSLIFIQHTSCSSCGVPYISAKTASTSFTVTSNNASDASTFNWWIIN